MENKTKSQIGIASKVIENILGYNCTHSNILLYESGKQIKESTLDQF